ncbi:MAG: hypothetical protein GX262_02280 [Clostridia bacterium]|nr:hypothetical protein [Clostridia bacterium]
MLIETQAVIALLCPGCGRLSWHVLSLFSLGRKQSFHCECGNHLLTVVRKRNKYWFLTECVFCQSEHCRPFTRKEIVAPYAHDLYCREGDYVTGCFGPKEEVKKHFNVHRRSLTQVALEATSPDYFQDSKVMFGILERLYEMAETGELTCTCGNHNLEIEIFPDKVEVRCQKCGMEVLVPAALPEDLENFLLMGFIPMTAGEFIQPSRQKLQRLTHRESHMD